MPIYPYSFQLPPLNVQDIPNDGAPGEFLGISAGGVLDWLPVATGGGDMLKSENLSGLADYAIARTNIGLGTASTPTFANLTLTSPSLASSAPVTISQTWNNAAVAFTGLKVNAVSTASASGSLLLDLQVGGTSQFTVRKDGAIVLPFGYAGIIDGSANSSGTNYTWNGPRLGPSAVIGWTAGSPGGTTDTILVRDGAANTLALRNGAAAQTFRVYNTYSNAGIDYERASFGWTSDQLQIKTEVGGSGISNRAISIIAGGQVSLHTGVGWPINFVTAGTLRWQISASGHFIAAADNTYDIGGSGANRPRNLYVGSNIYAAGNVGIGTTSPAVKLQVTGTNAPATISVEDIMVLTRDISSGVSYNNVASFAVGRYDVTVQDAKTRLDIKLNNGASGALASASAVMTLLGSGNVGIGTTSPSSKLHVAGEAFLAVNGSITAPSLRIGAGANINGWFSFAGLQLNGVINSVTIANITASGINIGTGNLSLGNSADVVLERDAQDELALRRGALGQKFSVYGTYPGAAWERFTITAPTSGNVLLGTYKGTGGIARGLEFQTDGVTRMTLSADGVTASISPTNLNTGSQIRVAGQTRITNSSDGVLKITDSSEGSFNRLQLGGSTDASPAIARDGAGIKFTGAAAGSTSWIKVPPVAVSALPLAATAGAGARAFVNDALSPTFGSAVTGGGAVLVPVYSDGSAWNVG